MADAANDIGCVATLATDAVVNDVNEGKIVASDVGATITGVTEANMHQFLYELGWAVAKGQLKPDKYGEAVKASGLDTGSSGFDSTLVSTIWLIWSLVEEKTLTDGRSHLTQLIHQLVNRDKLITKAVVREIVDAEFMVELSYVANIQSHRAKEVKSNTKLHYTQIKYNLLREESEGYAKLVTLLNQFGETAIKNADCEAVVTEMKSLIGFFNLDPSRVLDILLDAFCQQPANRAYLGLFKNFSRRVVSQFLGFKFQQQHKQGKGTSNALCRVAAMLIQEDLVSLESLMGHLEPSSDDLKAMQQNAAKQLVEAVSKIGVVSLVSKAPQEKGGKKEIGVSAEKLDLNALALVFGASSGLSATSQHLALLEGCLEAGSWEVSKRLAAHLQHFGIDPMHHQPAAQALCRLVSSRLHPLVKALYPSGVAGPSILDEEEPTTPPAVIPGDVEEQLQMLGVFVGLDQQLWSRLCRLTRHSIRYNQHRLAQGGADAAAARTDLEAAEALFLYTLLPAMTLLSTSPASAHEAWAILSLYPYTARFRFYADWRAVTDRNPVLAAASKLAGREIRKVLRRLHVAGDQQSKKESMRPFARIVGKIALTGPFSAIVALISQVESYANLADPTLDAMRHLTPFTFDVLTFIIVDRLASSTRPKLKEDGINTADWLKALSNLTAGACKKFSHHMGITSLCQYVVNQLKNYNGFDLLIISDLIKSMSGIEAVSDMSDSQVEACAGGPTLRTEAVYFALQRNSKGIHRSIQALINALQQGPPEQQLVLPLLVLICQQRNSAEIMENAKDIKFISEQYDMSQQAFQQMLEFLRVALSPEQIVALLPSPLQMHREYGLDAATVLAIHRPMLASVQPPAVPSVEDGEIGEPEPSTAPAGESKNEPAAPSAGADVPDEAQSSWAQQVAMVRKLYPETLWDVLSPDLVLTFWSLCLSDIHFPAARYEQEEKQMHAGIKAKQNAVREAKQAEEAARHQTDMNRRGGHDEVVFPTSTLDIPAAEKEIARLQEAVKKLPGEAKRQAAHVAEVEKRLRRLHDLLSQQTVLSGRAAKEMLQKCIIPRLLMSPEDAMFCARFVHRMHDLDMPGFLTCLVINEAFILLLPYLFIATDTEAINVGIFLGAVMQLYERWLADEKVYTVECMGKYGFREKFSEPKPVSFAQFRELTEKWGNRLRTACLASLRSGDYVRIKNTLHVLSRLIKVYPKLETHAIQLRNAANEIVKAGKEGREAREDILNRANNYQAIVTAELKRKNRFIKTVAPGKPAAKTSEQAAAADGKPATAGKAKADQKGKADQKPTSTRSTSEPGQIKAEAKEAAKANGSSANGGREAVKAERRDLLRSDRRESGRTEKRESVRAKEASRADNKKDEPRRDSAKAEPSSQKRPREETAAPSAGAKRAREGTDGATGDRAASGRKPSSADLLAKSPLRADAPEFKPAAAAAGSSRAAKAEAKERPKHEPVTFKAPATAEGDRAPRRIKGEETERAAAERQRSLDKLEAGRSSRRAAVSRDATVSGRRDERGATRASEAEAGSGGSSRDKAGSKRKREPEAAPAGNDRQERPRAERSGRAEAKEAKEAGKAVEEKKVAEDQARKDALKAFEQQQRPTKAEPAEPQRRREGGMFGRVIAGLGLEKSAADDGPPGLTRRSSKRSRSAAEPSVAAADEKAAAETEGDADTKSESKKEKKDKKDKKSKKSKKGKKSKKDKAEVDPVP